MIQCLKCDKESKGDKKNGTEIIPGQMRPLAPSISARMGLKAPVNQLPNGDRTSLLAVGGEGQVSVGS